MQLLYTQVVLIALRETFVQPIRLEPQMEESLAHQMQRLVHRDQKCCFWILLCIYFDPHRGLCIHKSKITVQYITSTKCFETSPIFDVDQC